MKKTMSGSVELVKTRANSQRLHTEQPLKQSHIKSHWPHDLGQLFDLCSDYFIRY